MAMQTTKIKISEIKKFWNFNSYEYEVFEHSFAHVGNAK
jgi:hypothetical protein